MPDFDEFTVYDIKIAGIFRIRASSSVDAVNKAKEWVEDNPNKLDYTWTEQTVYEEAET